MNISGIYKIQSLIHPEKCYIGSALNIAKRWEQHLRSLKYNKHHSQKLQRHFNKYGKNDLIFSILIGCDKPDLITTEQYFIDSYNPYFNGCKKAGSNGGFNLTEEQRKKISKANSGEKNPNYGKHFTEEHRRKISESKKGIIINKGRIRTEEERRKISESKKGKKHPHKGYRPSDEGIAEIKRKLKGRIPWNKGLKQPEESKRKVSESLKKYHELRRMGICSN